MIKIAICDDEQSLVSANKRIVDKFIKEKRKWPQLKNMVTENFY